MKFKPHNRYMVGPWNHGSAPAWSATILMAGDIGISRHILRATCFPSGLCVSIEQTQFIYAGGVEDGFIIRLIQYPPFVELESSLRTKAIKIGKRLAELNSQWSFTIMFPLKNEYFSRREK